MRALRKAAKRLGARLLAAILRGLARRREGVGQLRVLVIRVDERVGNVLLTTPLLRDLLERADLEVTALVAASKASILEGALPLIRFDKKALWRRPGAFLRTLWGLRRSRYDVVVDAAHWHQFSLTSALLAAWTGAPVRVGHDRGEARRFYTSAVPPPQEPEWEVATKRRLLQPLGIDPDTQASPPLETALGQGGAADRMRAWLDGIGVAPRGFVGLAPGARKPDHRASPELFAAVGDFAAEEGLQRIVLWGPGEERLAEDVAARCGAHVAPPTSLDELAALMRFAAVVVANDTGPMHLSVACGAPTLALFRAADPTRWGHARLGHVVIPVDGVDETEVLSRAKRGLWALRDRAADAEPSGAAP